MEITTLVLPAEPDSEFGGVRFLRAEVASAGFPLGSAATKWPPDPNGKTGWNRMDPDGPGWTRMDPDGPGWLKGRF